MGGGVGGGGWGGLKSNSKIHFLTGGTTDDNCAARKKIGRNIRSSSIPQTTQDHWSREHVPPVHRSNQVTANNPPKDLSEYYWRELPQVLFLSRQNTFFVATKVCLPRQNCLSRQKTCFVAAHASLSRQSCWQLPPKISVNSRQIIAKRSTQLHLPDVPIRHNHGYQGVDIGRNIYTRVDPPYEHFWAGLV